MSAHGKMGTFDSVRKSWISYAERLEFYFLANKVTDDDTKKAVFISRGYSDLYTSQEFAAAAVTSICFFVRHENSIREALQPEAVVYRTTIQVSYSNS